MHTVSLPQLLSCSDLRPLMLITLSPRPIAMVLSSASFTRAIAALLLLSNSAVLRTHAFVGVPLQKNTVVVGAPRHFFAVGGKAGKAGTAIATTTLVRASTQKTEEAGASPTSASGTCAAPEPPSKVVPVTLLSGFLGSGKTTTLKHLLENVDGVKIGVIVNDVAAVNIDSKLVSSENAGVVQLQNGCACCSLADELLTSVETILDGRTGDGGDTLDAVVVELSGVADPVAIKNNWKAALASGQSPVAERTSINRVVTVVDASTFGTDWMTWDSAGHRRGWVDPFDTGAAFRKVPELLAEQVEAADLVLVNKADLAGEEQVEVASSLVRGLNDGAELYTVEFGKISPATVLGDDAKADELEEVVEEAGGHAHDHDHDCADEDCDHSSHSHSHDHAEAHDDDDCTDPDCTDASHGHSHSHDHGCSDPDCTDTSHSHSHDHACTDPDCTDSSHSHSHDHATSMANLGISNFVYKASVPFHKDRLLSLLGQWPIPIKDTLDLGLLQDARHQEYEVNGVDGDDDSDSPFLGVLRSKGFCWLAPGKWTGPPGEADPYRHDAAMFWSHAGKSFGINSAGQWWGSLPRSKMREVFADNAAEYERIVAEDFVTEEFDDRRQEIVFIGAGMDEGLIRGAMDRCLLTEEEMEVYRSELRGYLESREKEMVS